MYWGDKPYHSLDYEMKQRFGEKVYRLALNGGMTCPNRDGKLDKRGCIFCSAGGSGDFAASSVLSISEQLASQKQLILAKRPVHRFIAYFQAYTNTYAPVDRLEQLFTEAIEDPEVVVLSIATRPDCLPDDVLELLGHLNQQKPVWVELGLQTIHPATAAYIRRGYPLSCYERAVRNLRSRGIEVITHVIYGLPGESHEDMLQTISYLAQSDIQGVKLQLLHILEGTDLATDYRQKKFFCLSRDEYIDLVIASLELLPPEMVIHRLTGDGPSKLLLAPDWSSAKRSVLNQIHHELRIRGSWQGKMEVSSHG